MEGKNGLLEEIEQKNKVNQVSGDLVRGLFTERCVIEFTKDSSVQALKRELTLF